VIAAAKPSSTATLFSKPLEWSRMRRKPPGTSIPMPIVKLDLGRFVTLRPRADGTFRVLFEVPPRLRPSDWSATIPLPVQGQRTGNLTDAGELARITHDAEILYNRLLAMRRGIVREPARSLKVLVRQWQKTDEWTTLRPTSRKHYEAYIRNVLAWSEAAGNPDPTLITRAEVTGFLALFSDRPATKKHTLKALRLIMAQAVALGWRMDNPCVGMKVKAPTTKASIWEQSDVDAYVADAEANGRASIALIILLEWEIGQRLTDVRAFRPGAEYKAGVFRFWQSKTDSYVTIPVSAKLRGLLDAAMAGQLFLFRDESTGKPYTAERLVRVFEPIRARIVATGGRALKLRWLRHSCVVQLARAGCTPSEIASITGHAASSIMNILSVYLPRDDEVAWNAQEKRGLVNKKMPQV
jgi:hypothetical protein